MLAQDSADPIEAMADFQEHLRGGAIDTACALELRRHARTRAVRRAASAFLRVPTVGVELAVIWGLALVLVAGIGAGLRPLMHRAPPRPPEALVAPVPQVPHPKIVHRSPAKVPARADAVGALPAAPASPPLPEAAGGFRAQLVSFRPPLGIGAPGAKGFVYELSPDSVVDVGKPNAVELVILMPVQSKNTNLALHGGPCTRSDQGYFVNEGTWEQCSLRGTYKMQIASSGIRVTLFLERNSRQEETGKFTITPK